MKVKVRGLVFVGFAAAVFAQSAFATITPNTAEKKIVTSKYYVDSTFQEEQDKVTTGNIGTIAGEGNPWTSATLYPSMQVVKGLVDSIDVNVAANSNASGYLNVTESVDGGEFTLNLDNAPATTAAELTGPLTNDVAGAFTGTNGAKLVTATSVKALIETESTAGNTTLGNGSTNATVPTSRNVVDYAEAKANKATAIITSGTGQNNTSATGGDTAYPTTAAVYDFVTSQVGDAAYQRKLTSADTGTLYVGQYDANASGDQSTWKQLSIADADNTGGTAALANTNYVAKTVSGGVYTVNLDAAQIADSIATDNSAKLVTENAVYDLVAREGTGAVTTINGTSPSDSLVPTVKNVYDFVDGNYQPKTSGTNVMVGYNGTWRSLAGDSYITVAADGSSSSVTLTNMTGSTSDFVAPVANDSNNAAARAKLAKSGDVYDFVMAQTGGLAIPEMPDYCDTAASNGDYCALVYGDTNDQETGVQAGLVWTVMAQPASN